MKLDYLLLHKEELPIVGETDFQIPIFPALLQTKEIFDTNIAARVFPKAAQEWHEDLAKYVQELPNGAKRVTLEEYARTPIQITKNKAGRQILTVPGCWEEEVVCRENGFVTTLSIHRNYGGSLYLDESNMDKYPSARHIRFTPEKLACYAASRREGEIEIYTYSKHNVEHYEGALFLRNWAILYLNESLKSYIQKKL